MTFRDLFAGSSNRRLRLLASGVVGMVFLGQFVMTNHAYGTNRASLILADDASSPAALRDYWPMMDTPQIRNYVENRLRFMPEIHRTHHRACRRPDGTYYVSQTDCRIAIQAVAGARHLRKDWLPFYGVIVARMWNTGILPESVTTISPPDTVYWIVRPDGLFRERSDFVKLTPAGVVLVASKPYRECSDLDRSHEHENEKSEAKLARCPVQPGARPGPLDSHNTPPWISCQSGCCYAEF